MNSHDVITRQSPRRTRTIGLAALLCVGGLLLSACWSADQGTLLDHINAYRKSQAKAAVAGNATAMNKAQAWSEHMAKTGTLEHTGGGSKLDPSGLPRWCAVGENVAKGGSIKAAHNALIASPSHQKILVGNFSHVGTGVFKKGTTYWVTEIFYRAC